MGLSSKQVSHDDWSQVTQGNHFILPPNPSTIGGLEIAPDGSDEKQARRQTPLRCPRCDSHNTKFCYYNNYSRLQPRHFCRACRRHWTAGGTLRNVPVGGGRKNKRARTDSGSSSSSSLTGNISIQQFSDGGLEGAVFPDVFKQLLFYSPDQSGCAPPPPPPHLLMPQLAGTAKYSDGDMLANPLPGSASSSSPQSNQDITDLFLTLMPSSTANTWLQDPPPLPSNDYSSWWDDAADFVAAPIFEQSATANE